MKINEMYRKSIKCIKPGDDESDEDDDTPSNTVSTTDQWFGILEDMAHHASKTGDSGAHPSYYKETHFCQKCKGVGHLASTCGWGAQQQQSSQEPEQRQQSVPDEQVFDDGEVVLGKGGGWDEV